jgi:hypothetical protein
MMSTAQVSRGANDAAAAMKLRIPASSLATLTDSSVLPSASTAQTQWCVLPTSIPTHALSLTAPTLASPFVGRGGDHRPLNGRHRPGPAVWCRPLEVTLENTGAGRCALRWTRPLSGRQRPGPLVLA